MILAIQIASIIGGIMLATCAANLLNAIAEHRRAQAASVLKHAGLLTTDAEKPAA